MKRNYIIIIIAIVLVALVAFRLSSNKKQINEKNKPFSPTEVNIPVKTARAQMKDLQANLMKTGSLTPFIEAKLLSAGSGTIRQLRFKLGDQVKKGQILVVLDTRLLGLDLQKSETNAAKLRSDLKTYRELLEGEATTKEKVNELEQSYADALNQSKQIREQISDANIKSPTSGTISQKLAEEGVFVNAGTELGTIVNLSKSKVQVALTEAEVYLITQGQKVKISTDVYPGKVFSGVVSFISPQADETRSYQVEVMISNSGNDILRSGTFVYADFSTKSSQKMLMIPREALTESVQNASVYVVNQNKVKLQKINVGNENNGWIEVRSGLKAGDVVVSSGQINLKDGTKVSISK